MRMASHRDGRKGQPRRGARRLALVLAVAAAGIFLAAPRQAYAQEAPSCCTCGCECEDLPSNSPKTRFTVVDEHRRTRIHFGTAASHESMPLTDTPPYAGSHTGESQPPNAEFPVDLDLNHGGVGGGRQIPHKLWKNRNPKHIKYELGEIRELDNAVPRPPRGEYDDALGKTSGTGEMGIHQNWVIEFLFFEHILPAMMRMQQQFTATMMHQALTVGKFIDAEIQMDTVMTLQRMQLEAHKDYHPNVGMCVFGTNVRSLASADFKSELTAAVLSRRTVQRDLANADGVGTQGAPVDMFSRLDHFKKRYCNRYDNNNLSWMSTETGLAPLCDAAVVRRMENADIDYSRTVLAPRSLNLKFQDGALTVEEETILSMSTNLYGHNTFDVIAPALLKREVNQEDYLDLRSVIAKRSVAQNSFNAVVSLKTEGSATSEETTYPYMRVILRELGMTDTEISAWLGSLCTDSRFCPQPSYMAQMEMLTKKLYQRPGFYTELYDKPVNTKRRSVAMQAIGVMLDRDLFKSYLRSEVMMSTLLELRLVDEQSRVQNLGGLSSSTPP